MAIPPGTRLEPYEILSAIGAGAGSLAQPLLAVRIAIPVIKPRRQECLRYWTGCSAKGCISDNPIRIVILPALSEFDRREGRSQRQRGISPDA